VVNLADRVKLRVRVYPGSARRGTRAYVRLQAADNRGRVRLDVMLLYRNRALYNGRMPMTATNWADPIWFLTKTPLPRFLPAGCWRACVRAWDEAGNTALACAIYRLR